MPSVSQLIQGLVAGPSPTTRRPPHGPARPWRISASRTPAHGPPTTSGSASASASATAPVCPAGAPPRGTAHAAGPAHRRPALCAGAPGARRPGPPAPAAAVRRQPAAWWAPARGPAARRARLWWPATAAAGCPVACTPTTEHCSECRCVTERGAREGERKVGKERLWGREGKGEGEVGSVPTH
jgi:hypothetical protein